MKDSIEIVTSVQASNNSSEFEVTDHLTENWVTTDLEG